VALLTAIGLCVIQGHWNILNIENYKFIGAISLCILLARITKRAQVPFSRWLPAAIAAPTPVSALVHSSTLVTAGVFLLVRFHPFIRSWPYFSRTLLFISVITLLIAGIRANFEYDIKKVIALSTLRQLGVIMIRLALNMPYLTLFHLYTHALFKAMLFLCAGIIIHNNRNIQDLRILGGLWKDIPLTIRCLNIANLALCGAPFLRGFYSKDLILEIFLFRPCNIFILLLIFLATGITSAYSLRFSYYSIWGQLNHSPFHQIYDEDLKSTSPIIFIRLITIFGGAFIQYNILEFNISLVLPIYFKLLTVCVIILGGWISFQLSKKTFFRKIQWREIYSFFSLIWFLIPISTLPLISLSIKTSLKFIINLDQGWLEVLGGSGRFSSIIKISQKNQNLQKNSINFFLGLIFFTTLLIIFFSV
jgi:NADH-ubiquinone oxidoreductase chain 5